MPTSTGRDLSLRRFTFPITRCGERAITGSGSIVKWDVDLLAGYEARFIRGAERRGEARRGFSLQSHRSCGVRCAAVRSMLSSCMATRPPPCWSPPPPPRRRGYRSFCAVRRISVCADRRSRTCRGGARSGLITAGSTASSRSARQTGNFIGRSVCQIGRIFDVPYAVDNRRFMTEAQLADAERRELRAELWRP